MALEQIHHDERLAARRDATIDDADDVRMMKARGGTGLGEHPRGAVRVDGVARELQRMHLSGVDVPRAIHAAEAPLADELEKLVAVHAAERHAREDRAMRSPPPGKGPPAQTRLRPCR